MVSTSRQLVIDDLAGLWRQFGETVTLRFCAILIFSLPSIRCEMLPGLCSVDFVGFWIVNPSRALQSP
jgi:hypothetical protein